MINSQPLDLSKLTPSNDKGDDSFGIYIHIPYCLQKCHYCDFVKFRVDELPPLSEYIKLLLQELALKTVDCSKKVKTLYFGGGTPSLLSIPQIKFIIDEIASVYDFEEDIEITIEINPGTFSKNDFKELKNLGVNRYSLGVQTFNPLFLQSCGRLHSKEDSLKDLQNLNDLDINYSADILFGLPNQSLSHLENDLDLLLSFNPKHVSPYNLTLPEGHFFNKGRAEDEVQIEMMELITKKLSEKDIHRYEISNYAKKGFESKHNRNYWEDTEYLGLGMGAHSYLKSSAWGTRTWNTGNYSKYSDCVANTTRPHQKAEILKINEALTDFCHTSLRQIKGMQKEQLLLKFGKDLLPEALWKNLSKLERGGLLSSQGNVWALTSTGIEIPNEVFRELCFLEEDLHE